MLWFYGSERYIKRCDRAREARGTSMITLATFNLDGFSKYRDEESWLPLSRGCQTWIHSVHQVDYLLYFEVILDLLFD